MVFDEDTNLLLKKQRVIGNNQSNLEHGTIKFNFNLNDQIRQDQANTYIYMEQFIYIKKPCYGRALKSMSSGVVMILFDCPKTFQPFHLFRNQPFLKNVHVYFLKLKIDITLPKIKKHEYAIHKN